MKTSIHKYTMASNEVSELTKEALKLSIGEDPLGAYHDLLLAAKVIKEEMEEDRRKEDNKVITCSFPPYK